MSVDILFKGLDWLEIVIKLPDKVGHDAFLKSIEPIFSAPIESITNYLNRTWSIQPSKNHTYRRYLQDSVSGFTIYLDNRSYQGIGSAYPIRIVLQKSTIPSWEREETLPLLWSKPFESMQEILDTIDGYYGECYHHVSRVDLAVHWTSSSWKPEYPNYQNFVTRLKKPDPKPDHNDPDLFSIEGFKFGEKKNKNSSNSIAGGIYNINKRVNQNKKSFVPFDCYPVDPNNGDIWNVEFKCWTRALRSRGIDSLQSLKENYQAFWVYLTRDCLTFRIPNTKDKTKSRWKIRQEWKEIQNAFGTGIEPLKRIYQSSKPLTPEQWIKRAIGNALGFITSIPDYHELNVQERKQLFFSHFDDDYFTDEALRSHVEKRSLKKTLDEATDN